VFEVVDGRPDNDDDEAVEDHDTWLAFKRDC